MGCTAAVSFSPNYSGAPEAAPDTVIERAAGANDASDDFDAGLVSAGDLARRQFGIDPDHPDLAGS